MNIDMRPHRAKHVPTFAELFTPKLVSILREGYGRRELQADALAGLTVAIVAIPLSMAIAIGSGLSPEKGLFTAIVGGFIISAFGGSRFQIGGPAGAFIVLVATIVSEHGYDGLVLATVMAGLMLVAVGYLQLGTYIKYIPFPVTVGFTAGIAVIIFASQIKELFGLDATGEPAALLPKLAFLAHNIGGFKTSAIVVSAVTIAIVVGLKRFYPRSPSLLIAVAVASLIATVLGLDIATIGTRFGELPRSLPAPSLPPFDFAKLTAVLPAAVAIALLGAIESLLSAVVADGMTGRRHRSNCELVAQGWANMASGIFGGMCATGTIARTATNVRAGAHGPVSGMLHSLYIVLILLVAAPLAAYIPLAALGGVLAIVSWNMAEKHEFWALLRASWGDALVLMSTFLLTIFSDLTIAIGVGVTLGAFLFMHRMAEAVEVEVGHGLVQEDEADSDHPRGAYHAKTLADDVLVYRMTGALFFGATATVNSVLDRIGGRMRVFVLDFSDVPLVDSTAANVLQRAIAKLYGTGARVYFTGANRTVRRQLLMSGLKRPIVRYVATIEEALNQAGAGEDRAASAEDRATVGP